MKLISFFIINIKKNPFLPLNKSLDPFGHSLPKKEVKKEKNINISALKKRWINYVIINHQCDRLITFNDFDNETDLIKVFKKFTVNNNLYNLYNLYILI